MKEGSGQPQSLIRDLMCAAVHSRAAYGYAMAAGHLTSLYNFALLQTVRHLGKPCSTHLQQPGTGGFAQLRIVRFQTEPREHWQHHWRTGSEGFCGPVMQRA